MFSRRGQLIPTGGRKLGPVGRKSGGAIPHPIRFSRFAENLGLIDQGKVAPHRVWIPTAGVLVRERMRGKIGQNAL
ncbi:hypothetical protein ACO7_340095 [Thiomonas arsenitoxydans]|nr:hypothetical protein ACO7_340095 [Thiomonas arsenitoxydans]CQR33138.1 hypothetical protein ACO3_360095 [Thiomonas arsenitoxydans]